jgi:hypothetical protein
MDLTYSNIHTDRQYEYSLYFTYDTQERCYMLITQKCSRITDKVEIYKEKDKWYYAKHPLDPIMQLMAEYYYNQWRHEENCEFIGFETKESKRQKILNDIKHVVSQEFELDKQYQVNSFGGRK